jgi:hypothetical protein
MPTRALTDLIVALLHEVADPRHHRCDHRGGRRHRHTVVAPASPPPPPLPSVDATTTLLPMELSDPDTHPRARHGGSCAVHGWDCPNWVAPVHDRSFVIEPSGGGGEEEDNEHRISVVTGLVGAPMIYWMTHISIGPRGQPQGPLKPRTITTPPTSPIPSLIAPGPPPTLPSSEANPSGSETSPDLKSPCSNRLLHRLTHHTAPSSKGRAPGSWDSTAGPSR